MLKVNPRLPTVLPGIALCVLVSVAAWLIQLLETQLFGSAWLEAIVLAILLGTFVRSLWAPRSYWAPGIQVSAKTLLEIAVFLLGASISAHMIADVGGILLMGIFGVVFCALVISYTIGRLIGLSHRMALLVACGNSICGNSAIAAVAPVIGASSEDIASSIAFTAVLGVIVVLVLPVFFFALPMSEKQYGIFAGLTVYAVPQVLAATVPIGVLATQVGTLVKLVRVLMLAPVVFTLSIISSFEQKENPSLAPSPSSIKKLPRLTTLVPWFIIGFLALIGIRSFGFVPEPVITLLATFSRWLTIISMAALGLGVDIRVVLKAGVRVTTTVVLSLIAIGCLSWILIQIVVAP